MPPTGLLTTEFLLCTCFLYKILPPQGEGTRRYCPPGQCVQLCGCCELAMQTGKGTWRKIAHLSKRNDMLKMMLIMSYLQSNYEPIYEATSQQVCQQYFISNPSFMSITLVRILPFRKIHTCPHQLLEFQHHL